MRKEIDIADFVGVQSIQSITEQLVEREKQRRKKMNMSQKELASKSGVSYASVRRFERIGEISLNSLLKIANALDCLENFNNIFKMPVVKDLKDYDIYD